MNIIETMEDPRFFWLLFRNLSTWRSWKVFLKALFGIPMTDEAELRLYTQCTGLKNFRNKPSREAYVIAGRRSGKSFMSSIIAVYLATFKDWSPYLNRGERGWVFIIANDRDQAKIIKNYIAGILNSNEIFKRLIERELQWEIELKNGISIGVKTCNYRTIRGFTVLAAICEEIAFWRDENSSNPAQEVLAALRPALATIPESMLIGISTPYSRSGVLWEQYKVNFGNEDESRPLVWKAPTRTMNPSIDNVTIDSALRNDPERSKAEWEAEWREDIEAFLSLEVIEAAIVPGRFELPKVRDTQYLGFIDPSGGRQDSFTMAICHKEPNGKIILDCVREFIPPFQPQNVVAEFSDVLKNYDVTYVGSDRYAGEWVGAEFRNHGVVVESSELSSSEVFLNFLPLVMNGSVELLENRRLVDQLRGLERRTRVGGKDLISHGPFAGAHDDVAVAVAGAVVRAAREERVMDAELLGELMFPERLKSEEEELEQECVEWLMDRPMKVSQLQEDFDIGDDIE